MKKIYKSEVYFAVKTFIFTILTISICFLISVFIINFFKIPIIFGVIFFILILVAPFIFEKKIKSFFTDKILMEFDEDYFSLNFYKFDENSIKKKSTIRWDEIKSFRFNFGLNTNLTLNLKNGSKEFWSFKEKTEEISLLNENIFKIFYTYITHYNLQKSCKSKIELSKGFYNSRFGNVVLYSQLILFLSALTFHLIISPKTSIFSFFISISIILQQFIMKYNDNKSFFKIKKLNPDLL